MGVCAAAAMGASSVLSAAPAQRVVVFRLERPPFGEVTLIPLRVEPRGIEWRGGRQFERLRRDRTTGQSVAPRADLVRVS